MTTTAEQQQQTTVRLPRNTNQAYGIGEYAIDFMRGVIGEPDPSVLERTNLFYTDSVLCGLSALALGTNAPVVLRNEALNYPKEPGATVFGSTEHVAVEKAIVANCSAVREWDSNGTNFGYNPGLGHTAGEFGHNDYYPVAIAAAQLAGKNGADALRGMVCIDEIRGRLAEVFSLKSYKIDHVVHGAIGSAATYGAMLGATAEQIESAIGMFIAHYIPWRAIRAGKQLSDSKGASAAISTEAAILCMHRSMEGFIGPKDIFRNPQAIWRFFEPTEGESPFDLVLAHCGKDFAVMGMHFKIGLYEHQSAGALHGLITLLHHNPELLANPQAIKAMTIRAYEPAYSIIGDPAKRDPHTRQSADHSMLYIVSTALRKAVELAQEKGAGWMQSVDDGWKNIMLNPYDYSKDAIFNPETRALMEKVTFEHGGPAYDKNYPDGIPTSIVITDADGRKYDSGMIMYPAGHARNSDNNLRDLLQAKFEMHGRLAMDNPQPIIDKLNSLANLSAQEIRDLNNFQIHDRGRFE